MSTLRKKLDFLYKKGNDTTPKPNAAEAADSSQFPTVQSTRQRLERLVESKLRQRKSPVAEHPFCEEGFASINTTVRSYSNQSLIGRVELGAWMAISDLSFSTLFPRSVDSEVRSFKRPLFIDTETTGLSGGAGTLPFMIGSGFFEENNFTVKVMTLLDPAAEAVFLTEWCQLVDEIQPDCLVSFNGRAFDLPLIESRFVLNRLRYRLDHLPHLDFLYPARALWGWTFPSRRLGLLGEELLGLSREDDIAGEFIPSIYFSFLRHRRLAVLEPVIRHNALDIVGLAALIVLAASYLQDSSRVSREGEHLGLALLQERSGYMEAAELSLTKELSSVRSEKIRTEAIRRLAMCKKRRRQYQEAALLWRELIPSLDKRAFNELIVHTAYREGDMQASQNLIHEALKKLTLTGLQRQQLEERLVRLHRKMDLTQTDSAEG